MFWGLIVLPRPSQGSAHLHPRFFRTVCPSVLPLVSLVLPLLVVCIVSFSSFVLVSLSLSFLALPCRDAVLLSAAQKPRQCFDKVNSGQGPYSYIRKGNAISTTVFGCPKDACHVSASAQTPIPITCVTACCRYNVPGR